ncbi:MAG: 2-hydroxyacyl-CoA dehydratase [Clostridia bacterium]|nr:2-hydroxyacyl-CoA dehydratase [Clostridia bacterium]
MSARVERVIFTEEMKREYTILIPTMLPMHFKIIQSIFNHNGYKTVLLENMGDEVKQCGLRYVHNDTCYPALLVIGQFIDALNSGAYDPHKVALLITQTGGGCRASNYLSLLRKALAKAGYDYIPVLSLNFSGLEKNPGFKFTLPMIFKAVNGVLFGDLLMLLHNQVRSYEKVPGTSQALCDAWTKKLEGMMAQKRVSYKKVKKTYVEILKDFDAIERGPRNKVRVGIVGEIFVKFSPLGNNHLEDFLVSENAEVVLPGLMDFLLYCVYNGIVDHKLYGTGKLYATACRVIDKYLVKKQKDLIRIIRENSSFSPMTPFDHTRTLTKGYIGLGAKMGEGWLLTAEMLELIEQGVNNIVCTQPFGCLPNHIMGKGMMKPIKENHPGVNIVAIDYDPGATKINQENRIKLMLANANREV